MDGDYELNTGKVIIERFKKGKINPNEIPAVFVRNHAPFTWGKSVKEAVENSIVLEQASKMGIHTLMLNPIAQPIPKYLLDLHYLRKHG